MLKRFFNDKDKKVLADNYMSLLALQVSNYVLPLLTLPFLVRVLGAEKFGLVMFAQSLSIFLTVFVDFGFNISGTREVAIQRENKEKLSSVFSAIFMVKFFLTIIAFAILVVIINVFSRFSIDKDVYLLSFGIVIGQALFPLWFFQGIEKMRFITIINIMAKLIFTLFVFLFIRLESDYIYVPIFNSIGFIVAGLLGFFISLKYVKIQIPKLELCQKLFVESSSLFVSNFSATLYTSSNVFILGIFTGDAIVGVYSSMEKLILAIKNVYAPLYQAMYPWLAKKDNHVKVKSINKIAPYVLASGVFISLIIILFGNSILNIVYNDAEINSYGLVFKILSLIAIFSGLNMLYNALYFPAIKRYKLRMNILIAGGVFNLLFSLILVKFYGIYGSAVSVTSTELLLLLLGFYYFKKNSKL